MKINQLDKHRKDKLLKHINIYIIIYYMLYLLHVVKTSVEKIIGSHRTRCSQICSQGSRLLGSDRAPQWEGLIRLIHDLGLTTVYPWYSPGGPDGSWWKLMDCNDEKLNWTSLDVETLSIRCPVWEAECRGVGMEKWHGQVIHWGVAAQRKSHRELLMLDFQIGVFHSCSSNEWTYNPKQSSISDHWGSAKLVVSPPNHPIFRERKTHFFSATSILRKSGWFPLLPIMTVIIEHRWTIYFPNTPNSF